MKAACKRAGGTAGNKPLPRPRAPKLACRLGAGGGGWGAVAPSMDIREPGGACGGGAGGPATEPFMNGCCSDGCIAENERACCACACTAADCTTCARTAACACAAACACCDASARACGLIEKESNIPLIPPKEALPKEAGAVMDAAKAPPPGRAYCCGAACCVAPGGSRDPMPGGGGGAACLFQMSDSEGGAVAPPLTPTSSAVCQLAAAVTCGMRCMGPRFMKPEPTRFGLVICAARTSSCSCRV